MAVPRPWKYWLWALGLALDLVTVLGRGERLTDDQRERLERRTGQAAADDRRGRRGDGRRASRSGLTEVDVDRAHLEERLGLFVIIVLGESVAALVLTAAQTEWTRDFVGTSIAGFLLLVLLWLLDLLLRVRLRARRTPGLDAAPVRPAAPPRQHPRDPADRRRARRDRGGAGAAARTDALGARRRRRPPLRRLARRRTPRPRAVVLGVELRAAGRRLPPAARGDRLACGRSATVPQLLVWLLTLPVLWQFLYAQRSDALLTLRSAEPGDV